MKKILLYLFFATIIGKISAQKIEKDIFGEMIFNNQKGYSANMKLNIFKDFIFTDNHHNSVQFDYKYLNKIYGPSIFEEKKKISFFRTLIHEFQNDNYYNATYSVNIFDETLFKDNRNNSSKISTDIFGNEQIEDENNNTKTTIGKDIHGTLRYKTDQYEATLQKDIFDIWIYKDSKNNKVEVNASTFEKLKKKHGDEKSILIFWVNEFLF